ncbi:MAG: cytochrome c family protein [Pseudomonadota bacterium]
MDSFEWNKVFGAVLGVIFLVLSVSFLSEMIFDSHSPEKPGYIIEVAEAATGAAGGGEKSGPVVEDVSPLLASMDISDGQKVAKKCAACHTFEKGGKNKVGPALYGIVDRTIGADGEFNYSTALKAYGADKVWSYAELNGFLFKPKTHIKGTSMGFAGLKKTKDRAAIIAYLRTLSDAPAPLPSE